MPRGMHRLAELQQLSPLGDSRCSYLNNIPNSLASLTRDSPAPHHRDPRVPAILFQERTYPSLRGSLSAPVDDEGKIII